MSPIMTFLMTNGVVQFISDLPPAVSPNCNVKSTLISKPKLLTAATGYVRRLPVHDSHLPMLVQ